MQRQAVAASNSHGQRGTTGDNNFIIGLIPMALALACQFSTMEGLATVSWSRKLCNLLLPMIPAMLASASVFQTIFKHSCQLICRIMPSIRLYR